MNRPVNKAPKTLPLTTISGHFPISVTKQCLELNLCENRTDI